MSEHIRILVVDDDAFVRMLVTMELPGADVLEATRADEAFEIAKREKPDVILLDIRLPDGDGVNLMRRMRRTSVLAQTPILVITAGHDEADRPRMLKAGADEYLAKPIEGPDLATRIHRVLDTEPSERRTRRKQLLAELMVAEEAGDPDPVGEPDPEEIADLAGSPRSKRPSRFRLRR